MSYADPEPDKAVVDTIRNIWESDLPTDIKYEKIRALPEVSDNPADVRVILNVLPISNDLKYQNLALSAGRVKYIQEARERSNRSARVAGGISSIMFGLAGATAPISGGLTGAAKIVASSRSEARQDDLDNRSIDAESQIISMQPNPLKTNLKPVSTPIMESELKDEAIPFNIIIPSVLAIIILLFLKLRG